MSTSVEKTNSTRQREPLGWFVWTFIVLMGIGGALFWMGVIALVAVHLEVRWVDRPAATATEGR